MQWSEYALALSHDNRLNAAARRATGLPATAALPPPLPLPANDCAA